MIKQTVPATYSRLALVSLGLVAFFFVMYVTKELVIPLVFAALFAVALNPLVNWMNRRGVNRTLAITLSLLAAVALVGALVMFIVSQVSQFGDQMPMMKSKLGSLLQSAHGWLLSHAGMDPVHADQWLTPQQEKTEPKETVEAVGKVSHTIVQFVLVPIYAFLVLYYKALFLVFLKKVFDRDQHEDLNVVLTKTKSIVQNYVIGLVIQVAIVSALNVGALFAIGVPYALLLGVLGGVLTVIPYLGGIIGAALMIVVALISGSTQDVLLVVGTNLVIQFVNNHYIVPMFVASRVKLNALVSIVIVIAFGMLWGVPGMFLSIPITGIVKAICDRMERLEPLGFLLGDAVPKDDETTPSIPRPVKQA